MIYVDQELCVGCGSCIDECPTEAISLSDGRALVDWALCDGCGVFSKALQSVPERQGSPLCVEICPNQALTWVTESVPDMASESSSLAVVGQPVEVISVDRREAVPWRRAILPAVGGALAWVGREIVPRVAPLALDVMDGVLSRRLGRRSGDMDDVLVPMGKRRSEGRQRRRRHRRRGPQG
jgi:NAD-dependent dihydropyrimidine dehydrogenase PreA subunit